jgi:hypothetical protein
MDWLYATGGVSLINFHYTAKGTTSRPEHGIEKYSGTVYCIRYVLRGAYTYTFSSTAEQSKLKYSRLVFEMLRLLNRNVLGNQLKVNQRISWS